MAVRKVSMNHPNFPPGKIFGVEGIGQLENQGDPIEVDEEEYKLATGNDLEEVLAYSSTLSVEGGKKYSEDELRANANEETTTTTSSSSSYINDVLVSPTPPDEGGEE